jgi:hypothetical protein
MSILFPRYNMSLTYRDVLELKYKSFIEETRPIVGDELEKHLQEIPNKDYYDMMQLVLYLFRSEDTATDLDTLLVMKGATLEAAQKEQLVPIIRAYICTLRKIQSKMNLIS